MFKTSLDVLYSNKFCSFSVNSDEEIQKFFEDFQKKVEKTKIKKKLQTKILKWFSELKSKDQRRICTIQNKYLTKIFSQLNSLYKKDNNIKFEPTGDMLLLFESNSPKTERIHKFKEEEKNSQNQLLYRKNFPSNDESISSNEKENREYNIIYNSKDKNESLFNYFSIIKNNPEIKDDNKNEIRIQTENEFLIFFNRISSDENLITISDELLSDFEKFKKFFIFFSNGQCFKDWLFPKEKNGVKYFTLPSWISENNTYFTLCEIYLAFFEQRILFFYEYFLYTNRIYKEKNGINQIIELYEEIKTIVGQLSNESNYFDKIFSEGIIKDICNNNNINNEFSLTIFNEIKSYMKNIENEKEKIIKLLKMLTFLNCENFNRDRILFNNSYKKYILDYLKNEITQELIMEDQKSQIYKNTKNQNKKNNNKKDKNKLNKKETTNNENNKKEEENIENKRKKENEKNEKNNRDENIKNEYNNNKIKENEKKIIDEKKNKKNKECFLFLNNLNNKKDKTKKNKKKNNENKKNNNENKINSNDDLIRITSTTSLSTYKSSNYQEDQFSNSENDSLSIISDISHNNDNKILKSSTDEIENNKNNMINNKNINIQNNYNSQNKYININNNIIVNIQNNYNNNFNISNYITQNIYNYNIKNNCNNNIYYNIHYNSQNNYNTQSSNNIKNNYNNIYNPQIYNNIIQTNNNNVYYNIFQNNISFNNLYFNYYDQGIMNYYNITKNNLVILDYIKNECIEYIIDIIKENLDKKYKLKFGKYGSYATELAIEGSDIDICIIYKKLLEDDLIFCEELYDILFKNENKSKKFSYKTTKIFTARIPRIIVEIDISKEIKKNPLNNSFKYLDDNEINTVKIDLTYNEKEEYLINNMESVEYIKNALKEYPEIKPVILILKRYLKMQKMNEVYLGGIGSYALFLMVLNVIKNYQKLNPNTQIRNSQLLIMTFEKFSFFDFSKKGIDKDNYDYLLEEENSEEIPFILNPLTGKNVAQFGSCRGNNIRNTFLKGYNLLYSEINTFKCYFGMGFYPFNQCPLNSIINLFKVK